MLMPACTGLDGTLRFVILIFVSASLTITSSMTAVTTVPAVTEHVHRDKSDED